MKTLYDEEYYERGIECGKSCYSNYRWMPELTIPLAARIIEYLRMRPDESILDYGCAKGYLVKAFRLLHRDAYGYDISEYAISEAPGEIKGYILKDYKERKYDWIISKDVFEHVKYEEIGGLISDLASVSKNLFCVVPLGENGKYNVPAYELDVTHIIRENLEWWSNTFEENGFEVIDASYKVKYIKENWSTWEKGNGFLVLKSKKM